MATYYLKIDNNISDKKFDKIKLCTQDGRLAREYMEQIYNDIIVNLFKQEDSCFDKNKFAVLLYDDKNLITWNDLYPFRDGLSIKVSYNNGSKPNLDIKNIIYKNPFTNINNGFGPKTFTF